ncbi:MAG: PIN domain-containing protein [Acidobacteria bacterium]|nr:PIN domain-containing protein [Acidobacteriota bacterium]MCG3193214.1 Ribonuclease VapC48 [Thermoanaerobaculia bacterium]
MIALDTNILVYAFREDSPWHAEAHRRIQDLGEGTGPWAIPWPCIHEFLSIVTHPRIYRPPAELEIALAAVAAWMTSPTLRLLSENASYWGELEGLTRLAKTRGPRIHDARIAALCLSHGVKELWTADRDFGSFPRLRARNPLIEAG